MKPRVRNRRRTDDVSAPAPAMKTSQNQTKFLSYTNTDAEAWSLNAEVGNVVKFLRYSVASLETTLFPAWRLGQTVPNFIHISKKTKNKTKNFNRTAISWHFRKQVLVIIYNCSKYGASKAFLQAKKIKIEKKLKQNH